MLNFLRALQRNQRGNVLIITAAALPLIVGSAGLATDTIQWALWKRQLQRAADSAAIAGAYERMRTNSNGAVDDIVEKDLTLNQHTGIDLYEDPEIEFPDDDPARQLTRQVQVSLAVQKPLTFSSMFMSSAPIIRVSATAASIPGAQSPCVFSLENTTAMGIQGSGNGTVETDCPWMTNSKGNKSAVAKGSSTIKATVMASSGAIEQSANFQVGRYDAYVPQVTDPYGTKNPNPSDMQCTTTPLNAGTNLAPFFNNGEQVKNCFPSLSVGSGGTLTLPAGTYYINGGGVDIQGTLNCTGCTIIMTNSSTSPTATIGSFGMNASGKINITAPTTGDWAGIALYQDRRAQDSGGSANNMPANSPNKINGNSASKITGIVYFPNQQLTYNGNGDADWACMRLIARRIQFSGNNTSKISNTAARCAGTGIDNAGSATRVRLVA